MVPEGGPPHVLVVGGRRRGHDGGVGSAGLGLAGHPKARGLRPCGEAHQGLGDGAWRSGRGLRLIVFNRFECLHYIMMFTKNTQISNSMIVYVIKHNYLHN